MWHTTLDIELRHPSAARPRPEAEPTRYGIARCAYETRMREIRMAERMARRPTLRPAWLQSLLALFV